jgi:hypothetical protein
LEPDFLVFCFGKTADKKARVITLAFQFLLAGGTGPHCPYGGSCSFGGFENERPSGKLNSLFHPGQSQASIGIPIIF